MLARKDSKESFGEDGKPAGREATASDTQMKRLLKGMRVRDEFLCPITFELMIDAVVAADGHSYERSAITKWMQAKDISPRTGEPLENRSLIPNINLKRVIQDMIAEGGAGLYTHDVADKGRMIELLRQKLLVMQCLGPPESDWNQRNFQVTPSGCFGGRKMPENLDKEFIVFRDTTVSRRHFEISYDAVRAVYALRDLGSAGGSFIRIPYGAKKALHPGMILLMGKHQFTVSSVDKRVSNMANEDSPGKDLEMKTMSPGDAKMDFEPRRVPDGLDAAANESALSEIMDDAEAFLDLLEKATSNSNSKDFKRSDDHQIDRSKIIKNKLNSLKAGLMQQQISVKQLSTIAQSKGESKGELAEHQELSKYAGNSMTLTCFAPDASPIQGRNFHVGADGATVGRRSECTICMCMKGSDDPKFSIGSGLDADKILNIDSAVSTDHARIELDTTTGQFYILDGSAAKSSTNGTWYRLSGPHQESPYHDLTQNMEVLLGTVRFQINETETIAERAVMEHL